MRAPESILLVAGGDARDQTAMEMALGLARRSGARLIVAAIVSSLPRDFQRISLVMEPGELWETAVRERGRYLNALVSGQPGPPRVETRVLLGDAVEEIVREVSREKHDLVIVPEKRWARHVPVWLRFDLPARLVRQSRCQVHAVDCKRTGRVRRAKGLASLMER